MDTQTIQTILTILKVTSVLLVVAGAALAVYLSYESEKDSKKEREELAFLLAFVNSATAAADTSSLTADEMAAYKRLKQACSVDIKGAGVATLVRARQESRLWLALGITDLVIAAYIFMI